MQRKGKQHGNWLKLGLTLLDSSSGSREWKERIHFFSISSSLNHKW